MSFWQLAYYWKLFILLGLIHVIEWAWKRVRVKRRQRHP